MSPQRLGPRSALVLIVSLAALCLLMVYLWGALRQARSKNMEVRRADQSAYLDIAARMRATGFRYLGDRNRMPLYPALQAVFLDPEADPAVSFEKAKRINVILSVLLLAALVPVLRTDLPWSLTIGVLLVTAFTVFMFKAGWVQAELLFYFLSFGAWILLLRLSVNPAWEMGAVAGVVAGLAYLTKASMLPTIVIWGVWSLIVAASEFWRDDRAAAWRRLRAMGTVVLLAFVTIFPYLMDNRRIYGRWFYNVNTSFSVWSDSWAEVKQGPIAHGANAGWPDMQPDEIPSLRRYLRTHSAADVAGRLMHGAYVVVGRVLNSYGYAKYVLLYTALALFLVWKNRAWSRDLLRRTWPAAGFATLDFSLSFLMVAWYVPIATGNRFILGHFLPCLFAMAGVAARAPETLLAGRPVGRLANRALFVVLFVDLVVGILPRTVRMDGGH